MRFSERHGFKQTKQIIQTESMDDDLRIGLWNVLQTRIWDDIPSLPLWYNEVIKSLWMDFFNWLVVTNTTREDILERINSWYDNASWYEVYDLIEFVVPQLPPKQQSPFRIQCNTIMERELSGYRFVGNQIAPITSNEEIQAIENVLSDQMPCKGARIHLANALDKLSDRTNPDYRNSIKESISAVEAIAKVISGNCKATMSEALNAIEREGKVQLHKALKTGYDKIYGYTSDAKDGIRHAMLEESKLYFEDAYYMLVSCSAFINYLVAKAQKAGIELA